MMLKLPNGEFTKLRRQLQRKRHIKIEFCVKSCAIIPCWSRCTRRRSALSLAWHEWFYCCELALSSEISRRRLVDYVKTLHQKACCTCNIIIFLHSTNQINDFWPSRCRCRRHFFNFLEEEGIPSLVWMDRRMQWFNLTYLCGGSELRTFPPSISWNFEYNRQGWT